MSFERQPFQPPPLLQSGYTTPSLVRVIRRLWPFLPITSELPALGGSYDSGVQGLSTDPELYKSMLGTPVLSEVALSGGRYTRWTGRQQESLSFPTIRIPEAIVEVSRAKRIVTTQVAGRDGTFKEYVSADDYQVVIRTVLASDSYQYPRDQVDALKAVENANVAINVSGRALEIHGISRLVIQEARWPTPGNLVNVQPVELICLSDEPLELDITTASSLVQQSTPNPTQA
jgi:hypothetical protein